MREFTDLEDQKIALLESGPNFIMTFGEKVAIYYNKKSDSVSRLWAVDDLYIVHNPVTKPDEVFTSSNLHTAIAKAVEIV